jgi:hypothetical protein
MVNDWTSYCVNPCPHPRTFALWLFWSTYTKVTLYWVGGYWSLRIWPSVVLYCRGGKEAECEVCMVQTCWGAQLLCCKLCKCVDANWPAHMTGRCPEYALVQRQVAGLQHPVLLFDLVNSWHSLTVTTTGLGHASTPHASDMLVTEPYTWSGQVATVQSGLGGQTSV